MRFKLTLHRPAGPVDLNVTADATVSVGDVASQLAAADPTASRPVSEPLTLQVRETASDRAGARSLDGRVGIVESGLRSGLHVEIAPLVAQQTREQAAVLRVISGRDAGMEFALPVGSSIIGRDSGSDVRLSDPQVSKRHARLTIGESVEITDLNSANGVLMSGGLVSRASLTKADVVVLGETAISITVLAGARVRTGAVVDHVRSPRVVPRYPGQDFEAPMPPKLPQHQRFPLIALSAPLIMGGVLYLLQPQLMAVMMMLMTPLLLVGAWLDQTIVVRRTFKLQKRTFDESMLRLQEKLEAERHSERRVRMLESPSLAECCAAIEELGSLVWTRRPEHAGFLTVRLGTGKAPSRNVVVLPHGIDTKVEFLDQLEQLRGEFCEIADVPIVADLVRDGGLGVAGPRGLVGAAASGVLMQLIALHSPAELVVCALVSPATRPQWEWLKWLPHVSSPHSPISGEHLIDGPATGAGLIDQLEGLVDARHGGDAAEPRGTWSPDEGTRVRKISTLPAVVVVIEDDAPLDRGRLTRLAERGPDAGVYVVWCAADSQHLPAACRAFLELSAHRSGDIAGLVRLGARLHPIVVDSLDMRSADTYARALAPVVDIGSPTDDDSDLPNQVSYPMLAGPEILDSADSVVDKWRENHSLTPRDGSPPLRRRNEGNLRALVGHTGLAPLYLDLRHEGPHALVGGTTGAGKSEFLQSWVLGMASGNSPDRLSFLFVDYKGGAAFADCVKLPHTVGLVTDLSPHLVRRALTSLRAELRYREHVLQRKKAKDLLSLERTGDPDCPPSLVIIVDEFAALVQEVPEFVDGVVDVAQRGRSLGLHLILATQRPAGVIKDNLRANTNLRVALRMADADDSTDILGDAMAAHFDPSTPGRGAVKTGPGRLQPFQTGYAGGWTTSEPPRPRIEVVELGFGGGLGWDTAEPESPEVRDPGPNDIARMVDTIGHAASAAGVPAPRKPWLPELADIYDLRRLPNPRTGAKLPLGVIDLPEDQAQREVLYEPDRDGNLAVFGTSGSGKSTALRTIAATAAFTARGGPVHVYGLDFGSRALRMLEDLPHVGAIIDGDDDERVARLLRKLRAIVDERATRFSSVRAGSIEEYRSIASAPSEPRYLLLVDGIGAFRERYEFGSADASAWFTAFAQIAADGRPLGVHIIMTGDRPNSLPPSIAATVQKRIVLRLADAEDYIMMGVPKDILDQSSPAGRGILEGHEVQLAILGKNSNVAIQAREIQALAASMQRSDGPRPEPIRRLAERLSLGGLPVGSAGHIVVGLDDVTLGPASLAAAGSLLLSGPPGSGRTTALSTIGEALRRQNRMPVFLTARRSALVRREWADSAQGATDVAALAGRLAADIEQRRGSVTAILIEHLTDFSGTEAEFALDRLVKAALREGCFVVGEAETSTWGQAYTLAPPFKAGRAGLLLTPGDMDGDVLLGTPLGRIRRADFPVGRGFLIQGGRARKVQVAQEEM